MDWKRTIGVVGLVAAFGAAVLVTGCGIGTGPTQELTVDEPLGSAAVTDVTVSMGAGNLDIQPGAAGLVSGVIRYNVEAWKPQVTRTDSAVTIKQGTTKGLSGLGTDVVNDWALKLGNSPMRLAVTAGAYRGTYELGGLSLQKLSIKDGASKTTVNFSAPNPSQMESLTYQTGASSVTLTGLGDANFKKMEFTGGAGSFTLDFSGALRSDGSVTIKAGVGCYAHHRACGHGRQSGHQGQADRRYSGRHLDDGRQDVQHSGSGYGQTGQVAHHHRKHGSGESDPHQQMSGTDRSAIELPAE